MKFVARHLSSLLAIQYLLASMNSNLFLIFKELREEETEERGKKKGFLFYKKLLQSVFILFVN